MKLDNPICVCMAIVSAVALTGCQTLPTAGMLYVQHTVVGLDAAVGDAAVATSPAHIKIGYSNDFGTHIPMAVSKKEAGLDIYSLLATGALPAELIDDNVKKQFAAALAQATKDGTLFDIVSVYSTFETSLTAKTQTLSADVSAGNVFATGFAARHIARARLAAACVRIQELIDATEKTDTERKKQLEAARKLQCASG